MGNTFWDRLNKTAAQPKTQGMNDAEKAELIKAMEEDEKHYDDKTFNAEDVETAGYNTLNSALLGIPDIVVKAANSDAYKKLQALRERNKTASIVGDVAGVLLPTPALVAKGVSLGAKALQMVMKAGKAADIAGTVAKGAGTAADFLNAEGAYKNVGNLKGVAQGALRGGVESGLQVAPRLASGETDGKTAGAALLAGAGIGGVATALPKILRAGNAVNKGESFVKPLEESLIDKQLAARGVSGKDIKLALNSWAGKTGINRVGNQVNNAEATKKSLLELMKKNDILNSDEAQAFIQGTGKKFEALNNLFDQSGMKVSDFTPDILNDSVIKDFIANHPEQGPQMVQDMINKYSSKDGLNGIKDSIMKDIQFANKSTGSRIISDSGDVANAIKNKLDDAVLELDPNYPQYKADWKALQPLRTMVAREKMAIPKLNGGPNTAEKLMANSAINSMIGGGVGAGGAALTGFDPNDQSTWTPAALKAFAGLAGGTMINKLAPGVANYSIGVLSGLADNPKLYNALEKAGYAVNKANIPAVIERLQAQAMTEETPEQTREKMGEIQDPATVQAAKEKFITDNGMTPETADAAVEKTQQYGQGYMDKLTEKMQEYWAQNFSDQMSFADYQAAVANATDNFSPEKSVSFLYKDKKDRAKFLNDLAVSRKLNTVNLDEVYKPVGFVDMLDKGKQAAKQLQRMDLMDTIQSIAPEKVNTKQEQDDVKSHILAISKLDASAGEKRKIMFDYLNTKLGLDYQSISDMGLV